MTTTLRLNTSHKLTGVDSTILITRCIVQELKPVSVLVPNVQIFEDIRLPHHLPLSQRMINKGYTSDSLTVEAIQSMDLSYGGPDTPPSSQQQQLSSATSKKPSTGSRMSDDRHSGKLPPIKSGRSSRNSRQGTALGVSRKWPSLVITDANR